MRKPVPRRGRVLLTAILLLAGVGPVRAGTAEFQLFASNALLENPTEQFDLGLSAVELFAERPPEEAFRPDLRFSPSPAIMAIEPAFAEVAAPIPRPRRFWIGIVSFGTVAGSAYNSFTDDGGESFHFTNEGWFGKNTYAGGGDKASHLVSFYAVARLLTPVYEALDLPHEQSYGLGSAVSALAGLMTELGDGTNRYGFSYEDLIFDTVGAASAYVLTRYQLNDLVGFRAGIVPAPEIPPCCYVNGEGKDYSREIYTLDLKFAGLARRLHRNFGPARFLLTGVTYSAKGYPDAEPQYRERVLGFEVGLNVAEIARAVGVPQDRWWGNILLTILDFVRLPYTSVVFGYDLNHKQWKQPSTGGTDSFPYR
jgi:Predicted periplasmic lipoprotein (DUF2279)